MTDNQVQEALVRWLTSLTGLKVIKANQDIDRPPLPYMMVQKVTVDELSQNPEQVHYEELDTLNSAGKNELEVTPVVELEWVMMVYAYGEDGSQSLRKVKQAAHLKQIQEPLGALNIHETGTINDIPEFVDERWEPRSQMNVMLRGISSEGFVIDTIEEHTAFSVESI